MSAREVTIGLVQMRVVQEPETNLRKAMRMIGEAAGKGAQIVCLPELFVTPYFPQYDTGADRRRESVYNESIPGPTAEALSAAARDAEVVLIGGSLYERSGTSLFNTTPVFDEEGTMLGIYRKTHIPHDEDFYEQSYFDRGDTGFQVFKTSRGRIAPLICYDQWYPEAARCAAAEHERPCVLFRPKLSLDGNQWCALYGENIQDGVAGFGDSPAHAMREFDKAWLSSLPIEVA